MGLIINKKIQELMKGYPTVSDKYDVSGAVLDGSTPVKFGELVKLGSTAGYFEAAAGATAITDIAGFTVATNVKLAQDWPGTTVQINPGEAFNLLIKGFIAIELDANATEASVVSNAQACVILATGKVTTADKYDATTTPYLPNVVFTGVKETQNGKIVAEIYVK